MIVSFQAVFQEDVAVWMKRRFEVVSSSGKIDL